MEKKGSRANANTLPCIGGKAPRFTAESSHGNIVFPDSYAGVWVVLVSHLTDFTPTCSSSFDDLRETERRYSLQNCQLIGLIADDKALYSPNEPFTGDIGVRFPMVAHPNFVPYIDDRSRQIAKTYGLYSAQPENDEEIRAVFVIDPRGIVRTIIAYHPERRTLGIDGLLSVVTELRNRDEIAPRSAFWHCALPARVGTA
jgi:peroxiredoxin 2/4